MCTIPILLCPVSGYHTQSDSIAALRDTFSVDMDYKVPAEDLRSDYHTRILPEREIPRKRGASVDLGQLCRKMVKLSGDCDEPPGKHEAFSEFGEKSSKVVERITDNSGSDTIVPGREADSANSAVNVPNETCSHARESVTTVETTEREKMRTSKTAQTSTDEYSPPAYNTRASSKGRICVMSLSAWIRSLMWSLDS